MMCKKKQAKMAVPAVAPPVAPLAPPAPVPTAAWKEEINWQEVVLK